MCWHIPSVKEGERETPERGGNKSYCSILLEYTLALWAQKGLCSSKMVGG